MILVDSSVWIDRLRGIRGPAFASVDKLTGARSADAAITEPIAMELLAGAKPIDLFRVQTLVDSLTLLAIEPSVDYVDAAAIFRATGANGRGARNINDCLIAAVALRTGAELWHKDGDFEAIAAVTALRTVDLR